MTVIRPRMNPKAGQRLHAFLAGKEKQNRRSDRHDGPVTDVGQTQPEKERKNGAKNGVVSISTYWGSPKNLRDGSNSLATGPFFRRMGVFQVSFGSRMRGRMLRDFQKRLQVIQQETGM
jgi:hypothetical protein